MISKWDALSIVAEVQAEIAEELGEPAFKVEFHDERAARPLADANLEAVAAAEQRAARAEKRAELAERAVRTSRRNSRSIINKRPSVKPISGVVVFKVDGKRFAVKPGHTVEVVDGSIDQITRTPKSPFHAYTIGSIIPRDKGSD